MGERVLSCKLTRAWGHMQEMNEILMLDLGGLGGFRSPLGSPHSAERFAFEDHAHGPRTPDSKPLQPTWRVAEVGVPGASAQP
jgi:hypothetical protein